MAELEGAALVRRAYDRFGFGASAEQLATGANDPERAISTLLSPVTSTPGSDGGSDPGVAATPAPDVRSAEQAAEIDVPRKQLPPEQRRELKRARKQRQQQITGWWLDRMVRAEQAVPERLTWFWHGHFATSIQKVKSASLMLEQNVTLRRLGGDTFQTLAQAMIIDPALLVWLDGNDNVQGSPNENLGREFLELFSLGHGHYNETDVRETARALTGWKINRTTGRVRLVAARHDDGEKTIFARPGNYDAGSFVDLACDQAATAAFVVGRLWFRLVSATAPDDATKERLVAAYGKNGDIAAVLTVISTEAAFRAGGTSLVKQPVEWTVGLLRATGVVPSALEDNQRQRLVQLLRGMGQVPFLPPSVGGWPAGTSWLTTASALSRTQAARLITSAAQQSKSLDVAVSPKAVPDHVRQLLGLDALSDRTRSAVAAVADSLPHAVAVAACSPEYVVSR
ncbi:MAG: DUF1800 domain-containing protein [Propionibacteriaceae bacterium]